MEWSEKISILEKELKNKGEASGLPKLLGVRSGIISDIKSGKAKNPSSKLALMLINKLQVNPEWLETGTPPIFLSKQETLPFSGKALSTKNTETAEAGKEPVVSKRLETLPHPVK